jgi:hypothetical protein
METKNYTNGTIPHVNGVSSKIDTLLSAVTGKSAESLQDWALQQGPLLATLTTVE